MLKFVSFVEWPPGAFPHADTPLQIAVMGDAAVVRDLVEATQDRTLDGRRVRVQQPAPGEPLEGVHILFVREAAAASINTGTERELAPMLVVMESVGAFDRGSVINFVVDDGKVRFDVSLEAADKRGLKISSQLLTVARRIVERPR